MFYRVEGDTVIFDVKEDNGYNLWQDLVNVSDYGSIVSVDVDIPRLNKYNENYILNFEFSKYPKIMLKK